MLEKSFGLLFYLRKQRNEEKGLMYVILRVTVDGQQKEMSVKRTWTASRWNAHANRASGTKEDAKQLNVYLDSMQSKIGVATFGWRNRKADLIKEIKFKKDEKTSVR